MLLSVIVSLFILNNCLAARILMISTVPSLSHSMWNQKLAKLLAERNHKITMIDVGKQVFRHPNIEHHSLYLPSFDEYIDLEAASLDGSPLTQMNLIFFLINTMCKELIYLPQTEIFLKKYKIEKQPFDLIINDGACCEIFLGFVKQFGSPPLVQVTAYSGATNLLEFAGLFDNPSYVPNPYSSFNQHMTFHQRILNFLLYIKMCFTYSSYISRQNEMAKAYFKDETIDIIKIAKSSKIGLINTHPVLDGVKPYLPNIIPIGGFHIDQPKPLEKDLQTFLDDAPNGVIYFSLGSNLKCEYMKQDKLDIFIKVFKRIKAKILWKCGMNITNLPSHIKLGKWFKQNDVLAHNNVKLFISHGGLLSAQESLYNGVPMLLLPFIIDQHFIAAKLERLSVALRLIYAELTEQLLHNSITELLQDKSYQKRMAELSVLFRDSPISPKDLTIFWIEFVLRHPKTNILKSPTQEMSVYQLIMLDIVILFIVIIFLMYLLITLLVKMWKGNNRKDKTS